MGRSDTRDKGKILKAITYLGGKALTAMAYLKRKLLEGATMLIEMCVGLMLLLTLFILCVVYFSIIITTRVKPNHPIDLSLAGFLLDLCLVFLSIGSWKYLIDEIELTYSGSLIFARTILLILLNSWVIFIQH